MANTQTTVPLFVANTVLTAASQNISAGTGVPVFATTVTRDAAFGGSNKALAEGQLCYIEASNIVQYYDGAAWATVGPIASGFVRITGGSFSAVSSVSFAANTFSATYRNYRVAFNITANSTNTNVNARMRAAGTDASGSDYMSGTSYVTRAGVQSGSGQSSTTLWDIQYAFTSSLRENSVILDVLSPQLATTTNISGINYGNLSLGDLYQRAFAGSHYSDTQFDSMTFLAASGTLTGTYDVYGYSIS